MSDWRRILRTEDIKLMAMRGVPFYIANRTPTDHVCVFLSQTETSRNLGEI